VKKSPSIPSWVVAPTPKEVRDRFNYMVMRWQDIRREAATDMRFMTGDPWPQGERDARSAMDRLCLSFDELSQYINQLVNGVRQNKRAPKVTPAGNGANDQTAEMRAGMIKAIGYKSNADAARITAFENAAMRSYGPYRIDRKYINDNSELQELRIARMPNPDVLYMDPDCKEADYSDAKDAFELSRMSKEQFRREFGDAEIQSFSTELMAAAPAWIRDDEIQIAKYWMAHERTRTKIRFDDDEVGYLDEAGDDAEITEDNYLVAKGMKSRKLRNYRESVDRFVVEYKFNGVELLRQSPWTITMTVKDDQGNPRLDSQGKPKKITGGKYIPYVLITGKELFVPNPAGDSERQLQSLIRMARTPYMAYCYTRTAQLEAIQLTSKSPYFVYEGQVENHEEEMKTLHKLPVAYQEVKPTVEGAPAGTLLPFPQRPSYVPEIQMLEIYAQAARQAIQAAIGFSNPQVQRNRTSPISGKALQEFESQGDIKTFHFIDNYDRALEFEGRILNDLIPVVYDTERQVSIIGNDEKSKVITLNAQPGTNQEYGQQQQDEQHAVEYPTDEGDHELTISVGPSYDSQREEQGAYTDAILQNPAISQAAILQPGSPPAKIFAIATEMRDLGPLGDAIVKIVDPPQQQGPDPQQMQQALVQAQKQAQDATALAGHLQQELKEKTEIAKMEMANKRAINADTIKGNIEIAKLKIGAQSNDLRLQGELDSVEHRADMLMESELAPTPEQGPAGIHPVAEPEPEAAAAGVGQ